MSAAPTTAVGDEQSILAARLESAASYPHPVGPIRHIETHLSHVFLTGDFAYKIRKAVDLGFADFRSLAQRRFLAEEELRLNRRLAPEVYLGVVPITGTPSAPHVGGTGTVVEYAVQMRQFPPEATLDHLDSAGKLTAEAIESIAATVGQFHLWSSAHTDATSPWGHPDQIWDAVSQNLIQLGTLLADPPERRQLEGLSAWTRVEHARLTPRMHARRSEGWVREGHGDLHLANLAWVHESALVFDCLEFDPNLRWIDIQSDIAFCFMDLMQRDHPDFAWLLLNTWLEYTGDYAGLPLLRYYAVFRALVRAKVTQLRVVQTRTTEQPSVAVRHLLNVAVRLSQPPALSLTLTHGLSGSGKTQHTRSLLQASGAVRVRSDVERKRLVGLAAREPSRSGVDAELYTPSMSRQTYGRLAELTRNVLHAGWPVIVDATFIARWQRDMFREVAREHGVPCRILDFQIPLAVLRDRVRARRPGDDASEADLAVLAWQIETEEALAADEQDRVIVVRSLPALLTDTPNVIRRRPTGPAAG